MYLCRKVARLRGRLELSSAFSSQFFSSQLTLSSTVSVVLHDVTFVDVVVGVVEKVLKDFGFCISNVDGVLSKTWSKADLKLKWESNCLSNIA